MINIENIVVEKDFDEDFYERMYPDVKEYYRSFACRRTRYYHHYINYGENLYKNKQDAEIKIFGNIEVDEKFDENLYEKKFPEVKNYMKDFNDFFSKKLIYYHHYKNYSDPGLNDSPCSVDIKNYLRSNRKSLIDNQEKYKKHSNSIVLVNHASNPYGATNYLLNLFKLLKKKDISVCFLDEIFNKELYEKYNIDFSDVISYEKNLIFLCYIYEKLKPKLFYLNSIRGIFVDFINLKNPNVITHSHEIENVYGRYDLLPTYVVSDKIKKQFEDKHNHSPEIQPPIFLDETLELMDKEFDKELPTVSNHKGDIDKSKITIGMCGQTESRKNPNLFIEVSKKYPQHNFLWVGGKEGVFPDLDNLYHVPVVKFPFVYYKLFDYFVLFSQEDPCPYVVLENLYLENKVITFEENIHTDHKCELTKDLYFEFPGCVSLESVSYMIDNCAKEKATRNTESGRKYITENFTKINKDLYDFFKKDTICCSNFN